MTNAEQQSLIGFLATTPARVRLLVQALAESDARRKPSAEEFSAVEHVCHLNDLEREGYSIRIEKLLGEAEPLLPDFDGGRIAAARDYNSQQLAPALDAFTQARESNMSRVRGLTAPDLQRGGTLEGVGHITLGQLLVKMREHDEDHLRELSILRRQLSRQ